MVKLRFLLVFILLTLIIGCNSEPNLKFQKQGREVPEFSADHAYQYVEDQVAFGPRVPNSEAHRETVQYLRNHFLETAGKQSVYVQSFETEVYGDSLQLYNILAAFGPEKQDRILLAAHWDSRPRSDEEDDPEKRNQPILGADDGASGVAVLMELATIFSEYELPIGVDIILFDGEDYGEKSDLENYFLGSRYWGNNPPVAGYNPRFGILLDMVGGQNAQFLKEGYSMDVAPNLVDEIWVIGQEFGYGDLFVNEMGQRIADDHYIVERLTGIPMVNIIHHRISPTGVLEFPPYWHTQNDTMDIIDQNTLQAVGDVLLELIYNRIP
ncbi:M28 family peptidase [Rhodohalobacter sp. 614A]|uniref:M28 family peptidase n=1 Tax=Rhodohalobacter sp. 614A TaxID=2908649 RepID=UPI001F396806|nr:M28 family peptidase [Rhodohalobacter sp. 614A]